MAYPERIEYMLPALGLIPYSYGPSYYLVETASKVLYVFYIEGTVGIVLKYIKSTDYGMSWSSPVDIDTDSPLGVSIWYDRWTDPTGVLGDYVHLLYTDSGSDDAYYRSFDTATDTVGTRYTVFAGASTSASGSFSITRTRGGNIIAGGTIDAGTELFCYKSSNLGVNWTSIAAVYESASTDKLYLMPGWDTDNQDAMAFYHDASASEISVKYYDDSGDSWSEVSIATGVSLAVSNISYGHMSAACDAVNSQNLVAFWTAIDTANADLRVFKVTQSAQTETASNVVLNSTDDQGFCSIQIDTNNQNWYVIYCGKSDGSENYAYYLTPNYKVSSDGGANWGSETSIGVNGKKIRPDCLFGVPIFYTAPIYIYTQTDSTSLINTKLLRPRTTYVLGM